MVVTSAEWAQMRKFDSALPAILQQVQDKLLVNGTLAVIDKISWLSPDLKNLFVLSPKLDRLDSWLDVALVLLRRSTLGERWKSLRIRGRKLGEDLER